MPKPYNAMDAAVKIRRQQQKIADVPEQHRPAVRHALKKEGQLADYARQKAPTSDRFTPVRYRTGRAD